MSRFNNYVKTMIEESEWINEDGEILFVELRGEEYYTYGVEKDEHFKDEKELKAYLKKHDFEYVGGE